MAMRRALLVGIDDYEQAPLHGCVADAEAMERLLSRDDDGTLNFDTTLLASDHETITRAHLREHIKHLFGRPADVALLFFSGHGTENDLGGYLVTTDAHLYDEGVWLTEVLTYANRATHIGEIVIILDSCHSGTLGEVAPADNTHASLREGLSILTASRGSESSLEIAGASVFSTLVCAALEGGAADILGNVTVAGVYAYVDQALGAWDQRPLFKSHVARMLCLRRARPAIDIGILRRLPDWFAAPDAELALSPLHERSMEPHDPEAESTFRALQRCNRVKLIDPVGEEDMYYAAIRSTGCRLTALGRHYWSLANERRI
jgi:hypothetical protein